MTTGDEEEPSLRLSKNLRRPHSLSALFSSTARRSGSLEIPREAISCEERIHYPLYNPRNPKHNPHARPGAQIVFARSPFQAKSSSPSKSTPRSIGSSSKSLRRARSSLVAFAETIRSKTLFSSREIPQQPDFLAHESQVLTGIDTTSAHPCGPIDIPLPRLSRDTDVSVSAIYPAYLEDPFRSRVQPTNPAPVRHSTSLPIIDQLSHISTTEEARCFQDSRNNSLRYIATDGNDPVKKELAGPRSSSRNIDSLPRSLIAGLPHLPPPSAQNISLASDDPGYLSGSESTADSLDSERGRSINATVTYCAPPRIERDTSTSLDIPRARPQWKASNPHRANRLSLLCGPVPSTGYSTETQNLRGIFGVSSDMYEADGERSDSEQSFELGRAWLESRKPRCHIEDSDDLAFSEPSTESDPDFGVEIYRTRCISQHNTPTAESDKLLASWLAARGAFQITNDNAFAIYDNAHLSRHDDKLSHTYLRQLPDYEPSVKTIRWKDGYVRGQQSSPRSSTSYTHPYTISMPRSRNSTMKSRDSWPSTVDLNINPRRLSTTTDRSMSVTEISCDLGEFFEDTIRQLNAISPRQNAQLQGTAPLTPHLKGKSKDSAGDSGRIPTLHLPESQLEPHGSLTNCGTRFSYKDLCQTGQTSNEVRKPAASLFNRTPNASASHVRGVERDIVGNESIMNLRGVKESPNVDRSIDTGANPLNCRSRSHARGSKDSSSRKEDTSSGSNDSSQSDPFSTSTMATTVSSASSINNILFQAKCGNPNHPLAKSPLDARNKVAENTVCGTRQEGEM
ncbi:hypothetical protein AJ80_08509 [Polytolypa hystricis UAMH7299]|uniref:Uncharacterized protein n=1 Tax=Polytolypa hystricis (strain UAMH7299) TaxID=1447883 RepID=A0A2B7X5W6_POLH7|nr:hypothetical protein AJ80_08509 [Polytolypa hystricis UAMH7299]